MTRLFRRLSCQRKTARILPCWRREAGSYGKDVRGLNRLHQFDKVEIVRIEKPENSYAALEEMKDHVQGLLEKLGLPRHILRLCGGDMSFTSANNIRLRGLVGSAATMARGFICQQLRILSGKPPEMPLSRRRQENTPVPHAERLCSRIAENRGGIARKLPDTGRNRNSRMSAQIYRFRHHRLGIRTSVMTLPRHVIPYYTLFRNYIE